MSAAKRPRVAPVDLLIVVCTPTVGDPLAEAKAEADVVRKLAEGYGKRVEVRPWCTADKLHHLLTVEVQPRILLFIGHANAEDPFTKKFTLGFTDAAGELKLLDPLTITKVLTNAPRLELVVFAGCQSAELGKEVRRRGLLAVCWQTILDDAAAKYFTKALFGQLFLPDNDGVELRRLLPEAFKQAKIAIESVHRADGNGARFAIDDPAKYYSDIERRTDPLDGFAYTYSEFVDDYGGTDEWDAAAPTSETETKIHGELGDGSGRRAAGVPLLPQTTLYNLPHDINASEKWVPRPELQQELCAKVQDPRGRAAVAGVKALHGTGGVGKTSLAASLVHDEKMQLRFPDGVFWITMGSEADVGAKQSELLDALDSAAPEAKTAVAVAVLRRLIVLDDVWEPAHVQPFEALAVGGTKLLLTTRNSDVAHDFAGVDGVLAVGKLAEAEALDLLGKHLGRDVNGDADALTLVKQCYCLAIAVRAVAAMVNRGTAKVPKGDLVAAVAYLKDAEARFKQKMPPNAPHYYSELPLFAIFEATLDALSEVLQTRAMQLGVFLEDEKIPYYVLQELWGEDPSETLDELKKWELVEVDATGETVSLLDLHRDYLRARGKSSLPAWHAALLRGCVESKIDGRARSTGVLLEPRAPAAPDRGSRSMMDKNTEGYWSREHLLHHLRGCESVEGLSDLAPKLRTLDLGYMRGLTSLPSSFDRLTALRTLSLRGCSRLSSLPSLDGLTELRKLDLQECSLLTKLPSLDRLTALKTLLLKQCESLTSLPSLDRLAVLEELHLNLCTGLRSLPSFDGLTALKFLDLSHCTTAMSKDAQRDALDALRDRGVNVVAVAPRATTSEYKDPFLSATKKTVAELKDELTALGLPTDGKKGVLMARYEEALKAEVQAEREADVEASASMEM